MSSEIFLFAMGIGLLLWCSQIFVHQSEMVSRGYKISALVIGTTVVAVGTSLPELIVSILAGIRGEQNLALGNIVGSNISNILLILSLAILGGNLRIGTTKTQRNILVLCAITGLILLLRLTAAEVIAGPILLFAAVIFSITEYYWGLYGRDHEDKIKFKARIHKSPRAFVLLGFSLIGIIFGGLITVHAIELLSISTGISLTFSGLVVTAIATSLPELFVTVISNRDHEEKLALGNIIGSNIYNLALIGGLIALLPDFNLHVLPSSTWWILFAATLALLLIIRIYSGRVVPKWIGVVMVFGFLGYLLLLNPQ